MGPFLNPLLELLGSKGRQNINKIYEKLASKKVGSEEAQSVKVSPAGAKEENKEEVNLLFGVGFFRKKKRKEVREVGR